MHGPASHFTRGPSDRSGPPAKLPSRRTEKSKQSHHLCAVDGRDLSVHGFRQVLPGRSASHRVRACVPALFIASRPGRAHRATLEPARCGLRQGAVKSPMNASTGLSMTGESPMILIAPPFGLRHSKDARRVSQQNLYWTKVQYTALPFFARKSASQRE